MVGVGGGVNQNREGRRFAANNLWEYTVFKSTPHTKLHFPVRSDVLGRYGGRQADPVAQIQCSLLFIGGTGVHSGNLLVTVA